MIRPEDAFVPLIAAAVLLQMLTATPLRFDALFPPVEAAGVPLVHTHAKPEHPAPPRPTLVRDVDDHFGGAS